MLSPRSLLFIIALSLSSCGFQPVYKHAGGDAADVKTGPAAPSPQQKQLQAIRVEPVDFGRPGQILHGELTDALNPAKTETPAKYRLDITVTKAKHGQLVEQDREITRYQLICNASYRLVDLEKGSAVFEDTARLGTSFDAQPSDFATYTAEEDALKDLMKEMARTIHFSLIAYFSAQLHTE